MEFEFFPHIIFSTREMEFEDVRDFWTEHMIDCSTFRKLLTYLCARNFPLMKLLVKYKRDGLCGVYDSQNLVALANLTDEQLGELGITYEMFKWRGDEIKIIAKLDPKTIDGLARIAEFLINRWKIKEGKLRESDLRAILPHAKIRAIHWGELKEYLVSHNFSADLISRLAKKVK